MPADTLQPHRTPWDDAFGVGHELLDGQHQALIALCNRLADHAASGDAGHAAFDADFDHLKQLAREHFASELELLARQGFDGLDDHQAAFEEFEDLLAEVAHTQYFDRVELQRFVSLWWLGHVASTAEPLRDFLATRGPLF